MSIIFSRTISGEPNTLKSECQNVPNIKTNTTKQETQTHPQYPPRPHRWRCVCPIIHNHARVCINTETLNVVLETSYVWDVSWYDWRTLNTFVQVKIKRTGNVPSENVDTLNTQLDCSNTE